MRIRPLVALSAVALSAVLLAGCSSSAPDARREPVRLPGRGPVQRCRAGRRRVGRRDRRRHRGCRVHGDLHVPARDPHTADDGRRGRLGRPGRVRSARDLCADGVRRRDRREARIDRLRRQPRPSRRRSRPTTRSVRSSAARRRARASSWPTRRPTRTPARCTSSTSSPSCRPPRGASRRSPSPGMPEVELADDGAPTITIPDGDAPTDLQLETLKKGDGYDRRLGRHRARAVHRRAAGRTARCSTRPGRTARRTSFQTTGVVRRLPQALEGQTVGSQVLVVIPPAVGYGEGEIITTTTSRARRSCSSSTSSARSTSPARVTACRGAEVISLTSCVASSSSGPPARSERRRSTSSAANAERFEVVGLSAGRDRAGLRGPGRASSGSNSPALGADEAEQLVRDVDADVVLNGITGLGRARADTRRARGGRTLALANKESLIVGGDLVTAHRRARSDRPGRLRALRDRAGAAGGDRTEVRRLVLTASGGPFRGRIARGARRASPRRRRSRTRRGTWAGSSRRTRRPS